MNSRRISRRAAIIGGASGAGLVAAGAAAFVLSRGGGGTTALPTPTLPPRPFTPSPTTAASATPQPPPTPLPRGGVLRLASVGRFSFDTFDAHRTGEASVAEVLARSLSRLVEWDDYGEATLRGDLAIGWQVPDDSTLIFELNPAARWHPREPVNGRPLTPDDVVQSLQRKLELARAGGLPLTQRGPDWLTLDRIEATGTHTVTVRLATPDALSLGTLAGEFALIQAPEAASEFESTWQQRRASTVVGTGPWMYEGFQESRLVFERFDAGHRAPNLDAVHVSEPFDVANRLLGDELDEGITRDRRDAAAMRESRDFEELPRFEREHVISTFALDGAPWNSDRLVRALSGALNREWLAGALFGGRAVESGPVPPVHSGWAASSLDDVPGYAAAAEADAAEARQLWDGAGGPALGTVTIDFPSIFDPLYTASSIVTERLNEVLGPQFRPAVETYTLISERVGSGYYGNGRAAFWFGWAPPLPVPDPTRWFVETYRPGALASGVGAGSFDRLASEFTLESRQALVRDLSREVARFGFCGVVPWLQQRSELFRRKRFNGPQPTPFWSQHHDTARYQSAQ